MKDILWEYPYDTLTHSDPLYIHHPLLQYITTPEKDVIQLDSHARKLAEQTCLNHGVSFHHLDADDGIVGDRDRLGRLAGDLEMVVGRASDVYVAAVVGYLPWTLVNALVKYVFDVEDTEVLLGQIASGQVNNSTTPTKFPWLRRHLSNSDILHQSLLRSTRSLIREFPSPHCETTKVLPAFPVYNTSTGTGRVSALFRRRDLTPHEKLHPIAKALDTELDVPIGRCSVAATLNQFRRAFKVFTCGTFTGIELHRSRAIVTGGAVTACLMPWPKSIQVAYLAECRARWTIERGLGLPLELGMQIAQYVDAIQDAARVTDRALFDWLHSSDSPYGTSDVDVFFIVPKGAQTVDEPAERLVKTHAQLIHNKLRMAKEMSSILSQKKDSGHWAFDEACNDPVDFYCQTVMQSEDQGLDPSDIWVLDDFPPWEYEGPESALVEDDDGWSRVRKAAVEGRIRFSPTIRTNNSVTITGTHPIRHIQLMMPVVRAAEEVILPFDLDCAAVFYDGHNVYCSQRALRSLNTRTNMVDLTTLNDRARVTRIKKYSTRGFSTLFFETCRHSPRCDVLASIHVRDTIARQFKSPKNPDNEEEEEEIETEPHRNAHDYEPTNLPYGYPIDLEVLKSRVSQLQMSYDFLTDREVEPRAVHMTHAEVLSDHKEFKKVIMRPVRDRPGLIPMQFKWVKDAWLRRHIRGATAFEKCYMCKVDVDEDLKRRWDVEREEEGGEDEEMKVEDSAGDTNVDTDADEDAVEVQEEGKEGEKDKDDDGDGDVDEYALSESARLAGPKQIPLCESCSDLNAVKRAQMHDMEGMTALVTGGRTKIGFHSALKLLRCKATVLITTRFPLIAAAQFQNETDSSEWWNRLSIYAMDFRDVQSVVAFTDHLTSSGIVIDILINNAAQTIRRPAAWYAPLVEQETSLAKHGDSKLISAWVHYTPRDTLETSLPRLLPSVPTTPTSISSTHQPTIAPSSLQTQITFPTEHPLPPSTFPKELVDPHGDPLDLRTSTTWTTQITETPLHELLETMVINTLAPTILIQKLLPPMKLASPKKRFIINVSSPEGSFSAGEKDESGVHPHTNMAKSALNRLTQTVAGECVKLGVYVCAVDPGWVSLMGPVGDVTGRGMCPPLSEMDGAARVLDPVISGLKGDVKFGVLLRDFVVAGW